VSPLGALKSLVLLSRRSIKLDELLLDIWLKRGLWHIWLEQVLCRVGLDDLLLTILGHPRCRGEPFALGARIVHGPRKGILVVHYHQANVPWDLWLGHYDA